MSFSNFFTAQFSNAQYYNVLIPGIHKTRLLPCILSFVLCFTLAFHLRVKWQQQQCYSPLLLHYVEAIMPYSTVVSNRRAARTHVPQRNSVN